MSTECDMDANLQCIGDTNTNTTSGGWWYVLVHPLLRVQILTEKFCLVIAPVHNGGTEVIVGQKAPQHGE